MANFVEIFYTGFSRIHENAKSLENICLKDFSILAIFVTWSNTLSENESYLILHLKKFIWKIKFQQTNNLSLVGFKNYFGNVLNDLKMLYELENNSAEFHVWNDLLVLLPTGPHTGTDHHHHGLQDGWVQDMLLPTVPPRQTYASVPPSPFFSPSKSFSGCGVFQSQQSLLLHHLRGEPPGKDALWAQRVREL